MALSRKQKIFGTLFFCLTLTIGFWGVITKINSSSFGVAASVPENPINRLFKRLQEREVTVAEKEKNLSLREEDIKRKQTPSKISFILAIAACLFILLNFYFDYRHRKNKNF